MNSMMWLSQALGGAVRVWLDVAFVAGVMLALLFRSDRVWNWSLFQFRCGVRQLESSDDSLLGLRSRRDGIPWVMISSELPC